MNTFSLPVLYLSTMPDGTTTTSLSKTDKGKTTSSSTFKSLFPLGCKILSLSTEAVTKLKGQENYEEWSTYIGMMIEAISAQGIVCKGQTLDEKYNNNEKSLYGVIHP